ncbi:LacI family DNA-binding transcriptional regulator [Cellulomonas chengniuliangii]|uniref:LacI family transcriptional regulator n=1 Tax=Cellulomonas chengniuliangii TaxID=2968084 RepID=A0ABY5KW17_9CELL|nr:LacI family DNA-binding transcriptional regulator [Cellulomonas chengniuliangii]MCC2308503.1 LacI family transcriptional regulator [Cellulomonas chengniuliangii]MCC2317520.1 LacI family transcriptional regulator [Cellulomonas chengniuliangii]UUI73869.1 LacI family transcriptional regulator [Cellulomonas chengniuliangii]
MDIPAADGSGSLTRRPTISDVAKAAGVSIAVVSYALNGRPGVSAATRERVLRVADEFGWRPSAAARSMRTGPRAVGLVLGRGADATAHATSFLDFVTATQDVVAARGLALVLQIVGSVDEAVATYRTWWAERRFDVMIVADPLTRDPRVEALARMRAPAVVLGPPEVAQGLATVWLDDREAFTRVGTYLLELGHREVALVTGPAASHRTQVRLDSLTAALGRAGGTVAHEPTNATAEEAAAATRRLLTSPLPPSAIVYDSDQMAVAALDVARRTGLEVPWDLSVLAGSDSALCRLATPSITTLPAPLSALGTAVGEAVLAVLDGDHDASRMVPMGGIAVRGSTGPRAR